MESVRDELIEILKTPIFLHELADPHEAVADYLLDKGVTVQRWIPVTERLPGYGQEVIVYGGNYLKACVTTMRFWGSEDCNWFGVTHWQPMPDAPKEVAE